jgi:hypothetical protein
MCDVPLSSSSHFHVANVNSKTRQSVAEKQITRQVFVAYNATKNNTITAPALLVYADLINSGFERNIETAKKIETNELQYIK